MKRILLPLILLCLIACKNANTKTTEENNVTDTQKTDTIKKPQRPISVDNGKFFELEGKNMLYGGKDSLQHFDITNYDLNDEQFHYGIGRERFPALLNPKFTTIEAVDTIWKTDDRFILA